LRGLGPSGASSVEQVVGAVLVRSEASGAIARLGRTFWLLAEPQVGDSRVRILSELRFRTGAPFGVIVHLERRFLSGPPLGLQVIESVTLSADGQVTAFSREMLPPVMS